jgi:hypothetical protein
MASTTVFLTLQPQWNKYLPDRVAGMRVSKITQKRPDQPTGPVIKLTLSLPDAAFKPLAPEVVIEVPPEAIDFTPTVTVELPETES